MKGIHIFKRFFSFLVLYVMFTINVFANGTYAVIHNTTSIDTTFEFDAIFFNDSGYDEYITENKSTLGVDLKIKNNSDTSTVITPCLALYEDGNLLKTKVLSQQTISAGSEVYYNESININSYNTEIYTVKVFNWEEGNLKPLNKSIEISGNKSDFYGNSVTTAILIQDLEK